MKFTKKKNNEQWNKNSKYDTNYLESELNKINQNCREK